MQSESQSVWLNTKSVERLRTSWSDVRNWMCRSQQLHLKAWKERKAIGHRDGGFSPGCSHEKWQKYLCEVGGNVCSSVSCAPYAHHPPGTWWLPCATNVALPSLEKMLLVNIMYASLMFLTKRILAKVSNSIQMNVLGDRVTRGILCLKMQESL